MIYVIDGLWIDLAANGYSHIEVEVDGNVSFENARRMRQAGADIFVAGTSSIFKKGEEVYTLIQELRTYVE